MMNSNCCLHMVGGVAMQNCEEVFETLGEEIGQYLDRFPDGETGERARWIYFQREMLLNHPQIEIDPTVPELELHQWDGKLLRSLPLLRFKDGADTNSILFETGYDKAAIYSYGVFERMQADGKIPANARFQVSLPTPMASGYMYVSHKAHDEYHRVYERSLLNAVNAILAAVPHRKLSIQFDVCQEVLVFENYFPHRPKDYKEQIFSMLGRLGDAIPADVELGYHLCYGTPYEEHLVMPKDAGILVELMNGIAVNTQRNLDFIHLPVPKHCGTDEYFEPFHQLKIGGQTKVYLGLIHYNDEAGDEQRMEVARKYINDFGVATECGWGRSDPAKVLPLLKSHRRAAELLAKNT